MRSVAVLALAGSASADVLFASFMKEHGKSYASADELALRSKIFAANMDEAARLQKMNPGAVFGATKFADLTASEFKVYHNLAVPNKTSPAPTYTVAEMSARAASVDWRSKGAVVQVKDQAQCGSCWAFSSTGGIEGQWFLAGNSLTSVSEQELVSCDKIDDGCQGGLMDSAYKWLLTGRGGKNTGKIVTEDAYPYTSGKGSTGTCSSVKGMATGATIKSYKDISHSESAMATYVSASGPLPIAVDAQSHWQTYKSGVVSSCTGKSLDHGVLAVGYTSDYWIVKNSWGTSWGESGYIRLAYGSNQCGLNKSPTAPAV